MPHHDPTAIAKMQNVTRQMKELIGVDPAGKSTAEKLKITRAYRESQYQKELGIDLPELVAIVKADQEQG